mgnify:FL=1
MFSHSILVFSSLFIQISLLSDPTGLSGFVMFFVIFQGFFSSFTIPISVFVINLLLFIIAFFYSYSFIANLFLSDPLLICNVYSHIMNSQALYLDLLHFIRYYHFMYSIISNSNLISIPVHSPAYC